MKRMIVGMVATLFACLMVQAQTSVVLSWQGNTEPGLRGYRVHIGTNSGVYYLTGFVDKSATNYVVSDLTYGKDYFFAVSAVLSNNLESGRSAELTYNMPSGVVTLRANSPTFTTNGNTVLSGTITNLRAPFNTWFEVTQGANIDGPNKVTVLAAPNTLTLAESLGLAETNWVYRLCASNNAVIYYSPVVPFDSFPPKVPIRLQFQIQLIQSASVTGPWTEVMKASVSVPYPPKDAQSFYRSVLTTYPEYAENARMGN